MRYWFRDLESLVFWLKAVPLPEPFDLEKHWEGINYTLRNYNTPRGIETNEHRKLLIGQKMKMPDGSAILHLLHRLQRQIQCFI